MLWSSLQQEKLSWEEVEAGVASCSWSPGVSSRALQSRSHCGSVWNYLSCFRSPGVGHLPPVHSVRWRTPPAELTGGGTSPATCGSSAVEEVDEGKVKEEEQTQEQGWEEEAKEEQTQEQDWEEEAKEESPQEEDDACQSHSFSRSPGVCS